MKFGSEFLRNEEGEVVRRVYEKAQAIIDGDAIKPESFRELYGDKSVDADLAEVKRLEEVFESGASEFDMELSRISRIFEAMIHFHGEQNNWFGENVSTIRPSRFDDYVNGVDELFEYKEEGNVSKSFLALAIDATFNKNLRRKLEEIKREIDTGNLATVKYFEDEDSNFKGQLKGIPHVVVGAHRATIIQIAEMWLNNRNDEIAKHPIQFQILEEIQLQCEIFAQYARKNGKPKIAQVYEETCLVMGKILKDKSGKMRDTGHRDAEFGLMLEALNSFKRDLNF